MHICDPSISTFGIRLFCLGFSNASNVNSLDMFRKSVADKVKFDTGIKKRDNHCKEENMRIQCANEFILKRGLGYPTTCVYQFIFD